MKLPVDVARGMGRAVGAGFEMVDPKHRRLADANLTMALPELDGDQRRRIVDGCYRHFGSVFFELFPASQFSETELDERFVFEGWHHVENAASDRGLIFICGHFGSWQVATYPVARRLGGLHAVARPPDNPYVAHDLLRVRQKFGIEILHRKGVGHRVVNLLRRGSAVAFVIDQRVPPKTGISVEFLGHPARTSEVPAFIATRTGAPAIPVSCWPTDGGRFTIRIGRAIEAEGKGADAVQRLTRRYLESIEAEIRRRPELWLWMHDRWKM